MIIDKLENANYYCFNSKFQKAIDFLKSTNFSNLESGKVEIDGDDIFAIIADYETKEISEGKLEAHKLYADVQYVYEGKEYMGYSEDFNRPISTEYSEEKEMMLFDNNCTLIPFNKGMFMVLFPSDLHMPGIKQTDKEKVRKVVVKVKI